jgi:hypothetical protein
VSNIFKYFVFLIFLNNCSLDTKSGIWTDKKKVILEENNISKIFVKEEPSKKEFNSNLTIKLSSKLVNKSLSSQRLKVFRIMNQN